LDVREFVTSPKGMAICTHPLAGNETVGTLAFEVTNPWNWHHGSFDGVLMEDGTFKACGDPRRTAVAMGA
jgi:hypothetical protein